MPPADSAGPGASDWRLLRVCRSSSCLNLRHIWCVVSYSLIIHAFGQILSIVQKIRKPESF